MRKILWPSAMGIFLLILLVFASRESFAVKDEWRPVSPEDLQLTADQISKNADAAILFSETYIDSSERDSLTFSEYVRIKVFNERGIDRAASRHIPFKNGESIKDIRGRTIKPDGSIVELRKEDVFEKSLLKLSNGEVREKTFTLPSVTSGCIVEYRYRRSVDLTMAVRIDIQQEFFIRESTIFVKPFQFDAYGMHWMLMNPQTEEKVEPKKENEWHVIRAHNIPGLKSEPYMEPSSMLRMWGLLWYTQNEVKNAGKYWSSFGQSKDSSRERDFVSKNREVRRLVPTLIGPSDDPITKARKLSDYIQREIKNVTVAPEDEVNVRKFSEIQGADDVLKTKLGEPNRINLLYVAMLQAAGLDARIARICNRSSDQFRKDLTEDFQFTDDLAAVKSERGDYTFYDPGTALAPFGYISWEKQGVPALIIDKKSSEFTTVPVLDATTNRIARSATLTIDATGTVSGPGVVQYSGEDGVALKRDIFARSADVQSTHWREEFAEFIPNFASSDEKIDNASDPEKPLVVNFAMRIPKYVSKTGTRLLFQPMVFSKGRKSLFTASDRQQDVYFNYPWSEKDHIVLTIPDGYSIEEIPQTITLESKVAKYSQTFKIEDNKLIADRELTINLVLVPVKLYDTLKSFFDTVYKSDQTTISFKQRS